MPYLTAIPQRPGRRPGAAAIPNRADGALSVRFARVGDGATALADLYQRTPLRALFPRPASGEPITAVVANVAGGVAGGDRLDAAVEVGAGARACVVAQAAEKAYRAAAAPARVTTRLSVGAGAWLEWLAQETILFDGASLRRVFEMDVAPGGRLLASETLVFGRAAGGRPFLHGALNERWRVRRDGRLVWADALALDMARDDVFAAAAGFDGATALATVLYVGEDAADHVDVVRAAQRGTARRGGASVVNGVLVARMMDADAQAARRGVAACWTALRAAAAGLPARMPRLWAV